jgi:1,2-diacylglycerol 3-alpha-glucosyltransferase
VRIALVSDCYHPTKNGVTRVVDSLARGLRRRGHDVTLIVPRPPRATATDDLPGGATMVATPDVEVASLPLFPRVEVRFAPCSARRLTALFRQRHIEVVHTHTEGPLGVAARAAARRLGLPAVHTLHTLYDHYLHYLPLARFAPHLATWTLTALLSRFLRPYDRVIAPSERAKDRLRTMVPATPAALVPNGVPVVPTPLPGVGGALRRQLGLPETARIVLYVGRVAEEKRSRQLVDALVEHLPGSQGTVALLVGGGGDLRRVRARMRRQGFADRIRLPGYLPHDDVLTLYREAAVFVTASVSENHPLTLLEAAQAGLPLAVRDDAGLGSVAIDGVNGVTAPDDDALVRRTLHLLDDTAALARLGTASRHLAQPFDDPANVRTTEQVYLEAVASRVPAATIPVG